MTIENDYLGNVLTLFSGRKELAYRAFALSFMLLAFGSVMAGAASTNLLNVVTPLNSNTTKCYLIDNFTTNNTMSFNLNGVNVNITVNSISQGSALLDVYNHQYNVSPGQLEIFLNQSGYIYAAERREDIIQPGAAGPKRRPVRDPGRASCAGCAYDHIQP